MVPAIMKGRMRVWVHALVGVGEGEVGGWGTLKMSPKAMLLVCWLGEGMLGSCRVLCPAALEGVV